jgi:hypothetical protein
MKTSKFLIVLGLILLANTAAYAESQLADPGVAAPSPEQQAKMEKMMALMAPGGPHKALEAFAGNWNYTAKFWMAPDAKPDESTGTAEHTMIYAGRFLKQDVKGTWMNQPFEGAGFTGYDNIRGQYQTLWVDGMATGMMWVSGQWDAATNTLKQSGTNSCPLTGEKDRQGRSEWTAIDSGHNTYSSYASGPDGKEFKMMEIQYTRT